jgi:transcriptional regulator with PAS, ATPase and Fis domain
VTVLLQGETGTGKELAARGLHEEGPRRKGPFVAVDCGALPEGLLESELFGHVRGAFTGASAERKGAFARADGGTIFLDELAAISPAVQARLLRVVEERRFLPVGSDRERSVDVRIVGAAREDLEAKVAEGSFRPDLYYRLSVVRVEIPPLSQRREDIGPIVARLLARRGVSSGPIQGPNYHQLYTYDWPGNVRELRNVIERAIALSPGATSFAELRLALAEPAANAELLVRTDLQYAEAKEVVLHAFERRYLREIFERAGRNISAAARESGLDRKHLRTLLARHGLILRQDEEG